jgi:Family of unknown function (DUF6338)
MPSSVEALEILLVLLPGFLSARIVQSLFVRPQQTELDKIVEALQYSFIVYVLFALTFQSAKLSQLTTPHLTVLTLYSVGLGLLIATSLTQDWVGRVLRPLRMTQRTSNTSVWNDTFQHCGGYVLVELSDGRLVLGWVRYFSDREEQLSLFLEDAAWINSDGTRVHIDGPGILLTPDSGIKHLMFVDAQIGKDSSGHAQAATELSS